MAQQHFLANREIRMVLLALQSVSGSFSLSSRLDSPWAPQRCRSGTQPGYETPSCHCDALDVAPELDLLGEEGVASLAVFGALVGEVRFVPCGEFCCADEDGVVGHSVLLHRLRAFI
jgi:hypothetical protein